MKFVKLILAIVLLMTSVACTNQDVPKVEEDKIVEDEKQPTEESVVVELEENDLYISPLDPSAEQILAYNELTKAINEENLEEEAKNVAISFIYDFFSLNNKKDRNDIGGLTFIPSDRLGSFIEYALAFYYGNYESIVNTYGKENLPRVNNVEIVSISEDTFTYNGSDASGYTIVCKASYDETKVSKLKTNFTLKVMRIRDFQYNRELDYVNDFITYQEEMVSRYRILELN